MGIYEWLEGCTQAESATCGSKSDFQRFVMRFLPPWEVLRPFFFQGAFLSFLVLAAMGGTGVESLMAVLCAIIWASVPDREYRVVFMRDQVWQMDSPTAGWLKCQVFAAIYRAKGGGRDAVVVDA